MQQLPKRPVSDFRLIRGRRRSRPRHSEPDRSAPLCRVVPKCCLPTQRGIRAAHAKPTRALLPPPPKKKKLSRSAPMPPDEFASRPTVGKGEFQGERAGCPSTPLRHKCRRLSGAWGASMPSYCNRCFGCWQARASLGTMSPAERAIYVQISTSGNGGRSQEQKLHTDFLISPSCPWCASFESRGLGLGIGGVLMMPNGNGVHTMPILAYQLRWRAHSMKRPLAITLDGHPVRLRSVVTRRLTRLTMRPPLLRNIRFTAKF